MAFLFVISQNFASFFYLLQNKETEGVNVQHQPILCAHAMIPNCPYDISLWERERKSSNKLVRPQALDHYGLSVTKERRTSPYYRDLTLLHFFLWALQEKLLLQYPTNNCLLEDKFLLENKSQSKLSQENKRFRQCLS